jgi:molybdate transport system ATP-binding protein
MKQPVIIIKNARAQQNGQTLLDDVSFELCEGDQLAIVGAGGSGKSALAKAIAGKLFTSGSIEIRFNDAGALRPFVLMLEHNQAFKNLSNLSDFYYQQRYNSLDADDALTIDQELSGLNLLREESLGVLEQFNLSHRRNTPLIQLSNGEQKKFQLAKAILQQPQVLILDKAFTGLDVESRAELHQIVNRIAATGMTVILITDEYEIPACITHIAEITNGRLVQFAEKNDFSFSHRDVATHRRKWNELANLFIPSDQRFEWIVRMENVTIRYGERIILKNINWDVRQAEKWLVKGHNGAGKSTLLSLITADNPQAYSQNLYLFDKKRGSGESIWDIKKNLGFVSPELHRYFDRSASVHHVIASGLFDTMGLFRRLDALQEDKVFEWAKVFDLVTDMHKPLWLLPASEQRRALLARAMIKNPLLLVMDEPCQGLDDEQSGLFLGLVDEIARHSETTIIFVSHYERETPSCIDHVLELRQGEAIKLYSHTALTA